MADDFFDGQKPENAEVVEKIKVGEDEYTQDELQSLVGLGKIGREAEEKFKTKIDRVWPNYQKVINEKQEAEVKIKELEDKLAVQQLPEQRPNGELTQEQVRAEAQKQARELGIPLQEDVIKTVIETIEGQELIKKIDTLTKEMVDEGLPEENINTVLEHMKATGMRDPFKAYKDMHEQEWLDYQLKKLQEIKTKPLPTLSASTAGGKMPVSVKATTENLEKLVSEKIAELSASR